MALNGRFRARSSFKTSAFKSYCGDETTFWKASNFQTLSGKGKLSSGNRHLIHIQKQKSPLICLVVLVCHVSASYFLNLYFLFIGLLNFGINMKTASMFLMLVGLPFRIRSGDIYSMAQAPVTTAILKLRLHCMGCINKIDKIASKTKGYSLFAYPHLFRAVKGMVFTLSARIESPIGMRRNYRLCNVLSIALQCEPVI